MNERPVSPQTRDRGPRREQSALRPVRPRRLAWTAGLALIAAACGTSTKSNVQDGGGNGARDATSEGGSVNTGQGGLSGSASGGKAGAGAGGHQTAPGAGGSSNGGATTSGGAANGGAANGGAANGGAANGGAANASGGRTQTGGRDGGAAGANSDAGSVMPRTYTTHFPLTENPISEGGNWINGQTTGLDWHDVSTTPGLAIGHQSGASYTDGTALLTGSWGPTQTVEAVVHTVNQSDPCYQEVEMRLRSSLSAHNCTGYEISFKASKTSAAYLIIVRWNGALGDFTYLNRYDGAQYGVSEGDTVKATITGDTITAYLNGAKVGEATDGTYKSGNPGMGFNLETGTASCIGTNGDYGFTSYTATGE